MSLWRASWRGGMVTRSCPQVCIRGVSARIFSDTCLGGKKLCLCVPSSSLSRCRWLNSMRSVISCTRQHMARSHSSTARRHLLRRMPMESFSFRGHVLGNRIRERWILKLERSCGPGWRMRRTNTDFSYNVVGLFRLHSV